MPQYPDVSIETIDNGFIAECYDGLTRSRKFFKTWPKAIDFIVKWLGDYFSPKDDDDLD